ncbi:Cytoplasmic axial filament protein CafA and Ribonuclease G [hydrothermal vent metagenome]|uniref:Cytoplasmic axial filament protein CafA and Ribonuclease G n=1 Tax=hydrothermal vent metagenome TaxID=652676 RepID=A0A3B0QZ38_9ZZZZ
MTDLILVDEAVGETRACLFDADGLPVELAIERWSERASRLPEGSQVEGRVVRVDAGLNAAFVELPKGEDGFLPFGKKGRPKPVHEGAKISVQVTREALAEKGPNLLYLQAGASDAKPLSLVERMYAPTDVDIAPARRDGRKRIDAAIEQALAKLVRIEGGGNICIEQTRALLAIDVDTGSSPITGGKFNYKAAHSAFRQLRLRSLGGIVVIDFAPMRTKNERNALGAALDALAKNDPARMDLLPLSRFGTLELLRRRTARSPSEIILGRNGKKTTETVALEALRGLENEAAAQGGAKLEIQAGLVLAEWLQADNIGWQTAMNDKIGPRFNICPVDAFGRQQWEVVAQ